MSLNKSDNEYIDYDLEERKQELASVQDQRKSHLKRFQGDKYTSSLLKIVDQLEEVYGLTNKESTEEGVEGRQIKELEIKEVNKYIKIALSHTNAKEKRQQNIKASGLMASVLYLEFLLHFNEELRISFKDHPGLGALIGLLSKFKTYDMCKDFKKVYLNAVLKSLQMYEETSMMRINTQVSYKYLRMFYILVMYDNISDAAIIADMLLYQIQIILLKDANFEGTVKGLVDNGLGLRSTAESAVDTEPNKNTAQTEPVRRRKRVRRD